MRLVKISAPQGKGTNVAQTAFSVGIEQVSIQTAESHRATGEPQTRDVVDIETSTPKAKHFIDALLAADFYNSEEFSIAVRQPRSIISGDGLRELTKPLVVPASDIFEELWQFSHITVGFVGRNFIAACLLAYGLINQQILFNDCRIIICPTAAASAGNRFRRVDAGVETCRSKRVGIRRRHYFADSRRSFGCRFIKSAVKI